MTEVYAVVETYDFQCGRCGHTWEQAYEVRRWQDPEGDEFTCYCMNGVPVDVPTDTPCPGCGGYRVRVLPLHPHGTPEDGHGRASEQHARRACADRWYGWAVLGEISRLPGSRR